MSNKRTETELGYIYFIQCEDLIKIGYTKGSIEKRLKQLKTGNGKEMNIVYFVEGSKDVETNFHLMFKDFKVSGEWFQFNDYIKNWIKRDIITKKELRELGYIK